jgi:WD40 repeat protein
VVIKVNADAMNERERKEIEVFNLAIEFSSPEERAAYLSQVCAHDVALRQKVEALLRVHAEADQYFGTVPKDVRRASFSGLAGAAQAASDVHINAISETPGDRIGRYKLLEKIGEGGMGVVYMAEQEEPVRRRVALKIIKLGMDTKQVVARFEAERQALALMDHPNIAKVLDGGAADTGRPFFVMELVQGVPITEFCDKNRLSAEERVKLFLPVCQAIQSAHQKGIIHRDLKPTNILVTFNPDGSGMPMVIDFGVAKATNQKLTEKTVFTNYAAMIGTPAYMSPEQAEMSRLDVDTRSDIYGLGVLLYELLTGTTPFPEKRLRSVGYNEIQRIIVEEEPDRPSTRLSTLRGEQRSVVASNRGGSELTLGRAFPGDLDWIVMKCLEKDRGRRYETANGLARDLQRHLNNEPVVARPPSGAYRVRKFVYRNRVMVTAATAVGVVLILGTFVSTWQAIRATHAKREAEANERKAQAAQANEAQQRRRAEAGERSAQRLLYHASMQLAQEAWEQDNVRRLQELLDETATYPDRGFEWFYWQRQTHSELMTLRGHGAGVVSVALSRDGQRIVTGGWEGTAKVWDAATGGELLTLRGHRDGVNCAAFSPDGRRIVTGSGDRTAKVWDAATGNEQLTLTGHMGWVSSVAFSPDGRRIATGSADQTARVWDAASGTNLCAFKGHRAEINSVAFSPDGQRMVTGSRDFTAKVWDATGGNEPFTLKGHTDGISSARFSPDGRRLGTGSFDQTAKVWDLATRKELFALKGHTNRIWSVAFSTDGQRIATASKDATARVWDATTGSQLLVLIGHSTNVGSVAFSPDGRCLVTGGGDRTAKVWDAANGQLLLTLRGHSDAVWPVAFSPDGRRIVTGSEDRTAKVWDAANGTQLLTLQGHSTWLELVAFSPDGRRIVTGSGDHSAKVWEAATDQQVDAWRREERAATERLAALRREQAAAALHERARRTSAPGAIEQWLVLAPIAFEGGGVKGSGAVALGREQVPHEAYLHPRAGDRVKVGQRELVWKALRLEDYLIDFNQLAGQQTEWSVAYALCYIHSETAQTGLLMKVGSDDQAKVCLNGKEIYRNEAARPFVPDQDVVTGVALRAEQNVLVFKVVNETEEWVGSAQFTDAAGQPVKGFRVTLTPP